MIGCIIGDVVGSVYEFNGTKSQDFEFFHPDGDYTDDSILTIATARAILDGKPYEQMYKEFGQKYPCPMGNYGSGFRKWLYASDMKPYSSFGNGSAMRVGPVGYAFNDMALALQEARRSAEVTHSHPEGIKGAEATVMAIVMARQGRTKEQIRERITQAFRYDLKRTCDDIRPTYSFDVTCQGTVPEAIIAFLDSSSFEDAIRKAVSLGGDADTLACITGGIAQAFYKDIPKNIVEVGLSALPEDLMATVREFNEKYGL
jgi:ADP-ribosylglycohydrolase